ncbi:GRIP and coiled-coil domain-containing protein 1 [Anguilla anguilla]|uniref:GRIP and coiled-coil domain-containing protein 1 n=1 Tax=Anguilla anguilla TaxID=7936 RepID=UPI0015AE5237|nr:GRIP and coiled-coil domain-containing protein 1 [Anguilla anguilla]XP_035257443.1 GRIP and coiled-coil domain-containing protein 1 [Anguilla anguilla]XP_035257444.1 GRIP and coiled-coil domain-containing protein 1 [Anguilla anguilla]XP_035257445.1 GRIP and coiled-coil domain-containing protein 1 [Anguilla anguilla]
MEKFGMNFGGGPGKKELLETIESQKKQLVQYQTRFKDVVRAYKSLLKEKDALEASLKVLTVSQEVDLNLHGEARPGGLPDLDRCPSDLGEDKCSVHSADSVDTAASADTANSVASSSTKGDLVEEDRGGTGEGAAGAAYQRSEEASGSESGISSSSGEQPTAGEPDRRVLQLKAQLSTLTSSLATVTQEKSRMEASFQADKRKMKQEFEELQARLDEERQRQEVELRGLQEQLAESKARVITQQHERAQEQGDHALMLRELQRLLQEERELRQDTELQLEDAREALLERAAAAERGAEYEERLKQACREKEEMRRSLQAAEEERSRPDPRVEVQQRELDELRAHFQLQLQHEMRKAAQAEERLREQARLEETRVASLEERVSELSELVGACERAKLKDQQTAQRLRERILQLDTENKTLAIAASARASTADLTIDEASLDVNVLRDKLETVKRLLLLASQRTQQPLDGDKLGEAELGRENEPSDGEKASALYYQQELKQLKEEFERYKTRAQAVLKNKSAKDGSAARELEEQREQLAELKEKYIGLRIQSDEAEARHRAELEARQQQALLLQQGHRQELERLEAQHRESSLRLDEELHKQRDRTLALLAEKDRELERLRAAALVRKADPPEPHADGDSDDAAGAESSAQEMMALKLAGPNEPTLLLYAEQLARKEVELSALRRQKHRLEADVHQLQDKLIARAERHDEEVSQLRDQLDKHARDTNREGANLEYLKNIVYRFLTLQDTRGRQQTLTAILTILHFSPQEKQAVIKLQAQGWWTSGMR